MSSGINRSCKPHPIVAQFNDEILISNIDAERLKKYIKDNFRVYDAPPTVTA
jgi:hypothetical protein